MNFSGWVPFRRAILEHAMRHLSVHEFAALTALILLADKSSGRGFINAPVLRTYLPSLTRDGAKRVLNSLEEKGYILRQITPRSPLIYPYWVNKYSPTTGARKGLQLDLSQRSEKTGERYIRYIVPAPDSESDISLASALDQSPEPAHYNNKEKENEKKIENKTSPTSKGEAASLRSPSTIEVETASNAERHNSDSSGERLVSDREQTVSTEKPLPFGVVRRDGRYFRPDGTEMGMAVVQRLLRHITEAELAETVE